MKDKEKVLGIVEIVVNFFKLLLDFLQPRNSGSAVRGGSGNSNYGQEARA